MQNPKCNEANVPEIVLPGIGPLPVLYLDDSAVAFDKPPDCPVHANPATVASPAPTAPGGLDLETALGQAIHAAAEFATPLDLRALRPLHHLDAEATGTVLFSRTPQSSNSFRRLFEKRAVLIQFLAIVGGKPPRRRWTCCLKTRPDSGYPGRVLTDTQRGQFAETNFEVLAHGDGMALLLASTSTARPHQIRVHLAAAGLPILGDTLYGFGRDLPRGGRRDHFVARTAPRKVAVDSTAAIIRARVPLALRAIRIGYRNPDTRELVEINATFDEFLAQFGFDAELGDAPEIEG